MEDQDENELKDPQFCPRDLPSLSSHRGIHQHFTVQWKVLRIQQPEWLVLQCTSCLLFGMCEHGNASFFGWQNVAALMLTWLSKGKSPLVTKQGFRNTAPSTVLKQLSITH